VKTGLGGLGSGISTVDNDGGEGGEDEPILAVEKAIRGENDKDEILHEVECKLQIFKSPDDLPSAPKEWKDLVKGTLRLTRDPETRKQRLLVRNIVGRILFNAAIYKGMKIIKSKKFIQFVAVVDPKLWSPDSKRRNRSTIIRVKSQSIKSGRNLYKN